MQQDTSSTGLSQQDHTEEKPKRAAGIISEDEEVPSSDCSIKTESAGVIIDTLPRVADNIPLSVWLVALLTMAERFSFYGLSAPFQNYMQNPRNDRLRPGAFGWGQSTASEVSNAFYVLTQVTPVFSAIIADRRLGRYTVLRLTFGIYLLGATILFISSLPRVLDSGAGPGIFITSLVFIAIGMSGANGVMAAFIGDQYTKEGGHVVTTKSGKRVMIDRGRTLESIYNLYYWCINVGSLSGIATTNMEYHIGFWASYLLPLCALSISAAVLLIGRKHYTVTKAETTALPDAMRASWYAVRDGFKMDAAKPLHQFNKHNRSVPWTEAFVDELKLGFGACRMLLFWPVLWLCRVQLSTNLISQAAQMQTVGVPNDMLYTANPIIIIIFLPVMDKVIFPWLRKHGIVLNAITRVAIGFLLEAAAMGFSAIVQKLIYTSGPCYSHPLTCDASNGGQVPNSVNVFIQLPIYVLEAFSEIFASPAGYELAFTMSPKSMKSILQAAFSGTNAFGAALSIAISPTYKNPNFVWVYSSLAVAMGVVTLGFYSVFGARRWWWRGDKKVVDDVERRGRRTVGDSEHEV
ncbi:MAG: hypothetical protein Q9195_006187 [Heterodermia aff. obscurata]